MKPDLPVPGTAEQWLQRARGNLLRAKGEKPEGAYFEDFCFDAQQAAEKAIKAIFIHFGIEFRYVHDLGELIISLESNGIDVPDSVRGSAELTYYAVETRYPGVFEPVTKDEYEQAVNIAETVLNWAEGIIHENEDQ